MLSLRMCECVCVSVCVFVLQLEELSVALSQAKRAKACLDNELEESQSTCDNLNRSITEVGGVPLLIVPQPGRPLALPQFSLTVTNSIQDLTDGCAHAYGVISCHS